MLLNDKGQKCILIDYTFFLTLAAQPTILFNSLQRMDGKRVRRIEVLDPSTNGTTAAFPQGTTPAGVNDIARTFISIYDTNSRVRIDTKPAKNYMVSNARLLVPDLADPFVIDAQKSFITNGGAAYTANQQIAFLFTYEEVIEEQ